MSEKGLEGNLYPFSGPFGPCFNTGVNGVWQKIQESPTQGTNLFRVVDVKPLPLQTGFHPELVVLESPAKPSLGLTVVQEPLTVD